MHSTERLEGTASILCMLEDKAGDEPVSASEIAAVRYVVESRAADLDAVWAGSKHQRFRLRTPCGFCGSRLLETC